MCMKLPAFFGSPTFSVLLLVLLCSTLSGILARSCTVTDSGPRQHDVIQLAPDEVIADVGSSRRRPFIIHEDPSCRHMSGKNLVVLKYDPKTSGGLLPCAYCCKKYRN